jgi:putative PIN family toxin of toxin-antitoxin system
VLRAVLDTNVYMSFLLNPFSDGVASEVVRRAWNGEFAVLISTQIVSELRGVGESSPYVRDRVAPDMLDEFLEQLVEISEWVDVTGERIWLGLRDPNDAYLLEMVALGDAAWLVSGDNGVLASTEALPGVALVSPTAFLAALNRLP